MRTVRDQVGREVRIPDRPQRIVSLVPSLTELLFDLAAGERLVGVTSYCVHPQERMGGIPRVGGPRDFLVERVGELAPELVVASCEENPREQVARLAESHPVWVCDVRSLSGALEMIRAIGTLVDSPARAAQLAAEISHGFGALAPKMAPMRTAYAVWWEPLMIAGGDTLIDDLLTRVGLRSLFRDSAEPYPRVSLAELADRNPELLLLPSEPHCFSDAEAGVLREACPRARVEFVDGELFCWYGSRLRLTPGYLTRLVQRIG
ncbi:MAG: ABC transporter substrate-binding protein [Candidatus Eisenbacteria bacterium]|nr:ABC transporter substrate-binding protein [Candidatus Eisenbacteria bacterium]